MIKKNINTENVHFEYKGFKVVDFTDQEFARYSVTDRNRVFDDLNEAILYCMGTGEGNCNDSNLMAYVNTFITMIKK